MKQRLRKLVALALVFAMLATVLPMNAIAVNIGRGVEKGEQAQGLASVYPAISQAIPVDDELTVTVEAEEGAFPAGTAVTAEKVALENVQKAVDETENVDGTVLYAVDITFTKDGAELQPAEGKSVLVRFNAPALTDEAAVVHIDAETNEAEPVATVDTEAADEVAFEAVKFSVYAVIGNVVPRLTVKFMNGETEIDHMFIKGDDTEEQVDKIIFDPGAGTIPSGQVFKGWVTEDKKDSYTADDLMTIDEVRSAAMTRVDALTSDGEVMTYYAALYKQFNITYEDYVQVGSETKTITLGRAVAEAPSYAEDAPYVVNQGYSTDDTHDFEGWRVADGVSNITDTGLAGVTPAQIVPATQPNPTVFPNGTNIKVKGDVTFSVSAPEGHWLVFDENGKGATYNAPRFIKSGQTTQAAYDALLPMVRNGYTFGGWYKDAACTDGNTFTFGTTIEETTTVYAKWTAITNANYTVLIWKQNVAGDGYDFVEDVHPTGAVGSTPNVVTATGNNAGRVTGATYAGETGFHFKETDQASKTIAPEGNTVVNVYWDRNEYTLSFQIYDYTYTVSNNDNDNNPEKYGDVNGQKARVYWRNGAFRTSNNNYGTVYNGTVYTRSYSRSWQNIKTITALYGQNISSHFPISGYSDYVWTSQNSATFGDRSIVIADTMPAENVTFRGQSSGTAFKMNYYLQPTSLSTNHNDYELFNSITAYGNSWYVTYEEDFMELSGFNRDTSTPSFDSNGNIAHTGSGTMTVNFYYTRKIYSLNYMDGGYFDGNDNPITSETSQGQLHVVNNIAYGADLTSYNKNGDNFYEPTAPAGYVFEGWYIDSACTHAYSFTTMPEGGLTVYAKWRQIQYRVFLHPNAETDTTLDWGSESQEMNFRVSYGGKVSVPDGQRTGYQFQGWYTDPDFANAFTASTVLNDSTVTAAYDKTTDLTDPMDKWGNVPASGTNSDVNRFWITKKLDLYAKWSVVLPGADGIGIIYDAAGGTNAPSDTATYVENSKVSAGAAATPPADKVFDHWVLQTWNGTAYEDTEITVLPGELFDAKEEYARVKVKAYKHEWSILVTEPDPDDPTKTIEKRIYEYRNETTLADYVDENSSQINREDEKPDVPNNAVAGKDWELTVVYTDATYTIQLKAVYKDKEEETPTHIDWYSNYGSENDGKGKLYHSYTGIKINEAVNIIAAPSRTGYAFKGWTKTKGGTTADFLVWTGTAYQTIDGTTVTQVAADEEQPYDDLFAVWEKEYFTVYYSSQPGVPHRLPVVDYLAGANLMKGDGGALPGVHANCYYGGYYTAPPANWPAQPTATTDYREELIWNSGAAGTADGRTLVPTANATYYVKEVDASKYLKLFYKYTYVKKTKRLTGLWVMTCLDDLRYSDTGFVVFETRLGESAYAAGDKTTHVGNAYKTITVKAVEPTGSTETPQQITVKPKDVCGGQDVNTEKARLTFCPITDIYGNDFAQISQKDPEVRGKAEFSIVPYWVTKDGITVYAKNYRTYYIHVDEYAPAARSGDNTYPKPATS